MKYLPAALKIAFKALRTNKMRSALTMLGMVVGVGAVIAMVAVGQGASERVESQIESLGSNLIVVQPGWNNAGGVRNGWGNGVTLTRDDADAIAANYPPWHTRPLRFVATRRSFTAETTGLLESKA